MATTIKSTSLDFNAIKNNLKKSLQEKEEFADYNFEASGLSNILDVLAYNTHYNALIANFAINESYIGTAQLRSSLVSLAEGIGYVPDSRTAAFAYVTLSINIQGVTASLPGQVEIPAGFKFSTKINEVDYIFQTREIVSATLNTVSKSYQFTTTDGNYNIPIYEGELKRKTFLVGQSALNKVYILPDKNLDIDTLVVRVYDDPTGENYVSYTNIFSASTINQNSTLYIVKEAPNEYYELSFGDGDTLGRAPTSGNKVEVEYLVVKGPDGNGATGFKPIDTIQISGITFSPTTSVTAQSSGGGYKENIDSIRKNAPFQYAAQNRMVTAVDYSALTLRNYSTLIKDINSWGGEDDEYPEYGTVFQSIVFEDNVPQVTIDSVKTSIQSLAKQLSIVSFLLKFKDPEVTYIQTNTTFRFNPQLTTNTLAAVQVSVKNVVTAYFNERTGSFEKAFRRSNLLTLVDESSQAILSSRCDVAMRKNISVTANKIYDYTLKYPTEILSPDDDNVSVYSNNFLYKSDPNSTPRQVYIENNRAFKRKNEEESYENIVGYKQDGTPIKESVIVYEYVPTNILQIKDAITNQVLAENVGYFDERGVVYIKGLKTSTTGEIRIVAIPANQSAIVPERNQILRQDTDATTAIGVITSATN